MNKFKNWLQQQNGGTKVVLSLLGGILLLIITLFAVSSCFGPKNQKTTTSSTQGTPQECDTCSVLSGLQKSNKALQLEIEHVKLLNQLKDEMGKGCKPCATTTHKVASTRHTTKRTVYSAPVYVPSSPCTVTTTTTSTGSRGGIVPAVREALLVRYSLNEVHTFIGNIRYSQYVIALNPGSLNDTLWFPFTAEGKAQALKMINKSGRQIIAGNLATDANLAAAAKDPNFHYQ